MDRGTVEWLVSIAVAFALWLIPRERAVAWVRRFGRSRRTAQSQGRPAVIRAATAHSQGGASAVITTPAVIRAATAHSQGGASAVITTPAVIRSP
jgi:hypothetical protein